MEVKIQKKGHRIKGALILTINQLKEGINAQK